MSPGRVIGSAGGSGMGAAAARRLAADGYRVGILSSSGKGEALAAELGITDKTLYAHRANIMQKLQARTLAELQERALGLGLI